MDSEPKEDPMDDDDLGFRLAFKAIAGLMAEQETTHDLLRRQGAGTRKLQEQVRVLGEQVRVLGEQVGEMNQGQLALAESSERSLRQQRLLLEAMSEFADTSSQTQKRLSKVEQEVEELKRRFPEAS
jgi:chromosome segregation ATPase